MNENTTNHENTYRIRIKGVPNHSLADWLGDIKVIPQERGETLLMGRFADQVALRGLLDQLWNLNFALLSVERIEDESQPILHPTEPEAAREASPADTGNCRHQE